MSQDAVCFSLLKTRLSSLRLNRCFVAESTINEACRGLFASRDIEEGELITLYHGDALLDWEAASGYFSGDFKVMFGNHAKKENQNYLLTSDEARSYELKIGGCLLLIGDPPLVDDAAYLGHIINDAAILTKRDKASVDMYLKTSMESLNAAFLYQREHIL